MSHITKINPSWKFNLAQLSLYCGCKPELLKRQRAFVDYLIDFLRFLTKSHLLSYPTYPCQLENDLTAPNPCKADPFHM